MVDTPTGSMVADLIGCTLQDNRGGSGPVEDVPGEPAMMFRDQAKYFFDNVQNPSMMNSLPDAAGLYRKIISCREAIL